MNFVVVVVVQVVTLRTVDGPQQPAAAAAAGQPHPHHQAALTSALRNIRLIQIQPRAANGLITANGIVRSPARPSPQVRPRALPSFPPSFPPWTGSLNGPAILRIRKTDPHLNVGRRCR